MNKKIDDLEFLGCNELLEHYDQKNSLAVIFIHGFLGQASEWSAIARALQQALYKEDIFIQCYGLVLPGHKYSDGSLRAVTDETCFDSICNQLEQQLQERSIEKYLLIGYSLGGRVVFNYMVNQRDNQIDHSILDHRSNDNMKQKRKAPRLIGALIESSHWGLSDPLERENRYQNDSQWAERFLTEPLEQVLSDWYQQSVFSDLTKEIRQQLIQQRSMQSGQPLGEMLLATSLAKQADLLPLLLKTRLDVCYMYGAQDLKFKNLVEELRVTNPLHWQFNEIAQVGHNIHQYQNISYLTTVFNFITYLKGSKQWQEP